MGHRQARLGPGSILWPAFPRGSAPRGTGFWRHCPWHVPASNDVTPAPASREAHDSLLSPSRASGRLIPTWSCSGLCGVSRCPARDLHTSSPRPPALSCKPLRWVSLSSLWLTTATGRKASCIGLQLGTVLEFSSFLVGNPALPEASQGSHGPLWHSPTTCRPHGARRPRLGRGPRTGQHAREKAAAQAAGPQVLLSLLPSACSFPTGFLRGLCGNNHVPPAPLPHRETDSVSLMVGGEAQRLGGRLLCLHMSNGLYSLHLLLAPCLVLFLTHRHVIRVDDVKSACPALPPHVTFLFP